MPKQNLVTLPSAGGVEPKHAVDPVCGMSVDVEHSAAAVEHSGTTHYFCGRSCAEKFRANPEDICGRS